jgi:hypothetical protein
MKPGKKSVPNSGMTGQDKHRAPTSTIPH